MLCTQLLVYFPDFFLTCFEIVGVVCPAVLADAVGLLGLGAAERMRTAAHAVAGLAASHIGWTAHKGGEAGAGETARGVAAAGVSAAEGRALAALVNVHTLSS